MRISLLLILISSIVTNLFAFNVDEKMLKYTFELINEEFSKVITSEEEKKGLSRIYSYKGVLKKFIANEPNSIWSDDAQFIVTKINAVMRIPDSEQVEDLEYLLEQYPNLSIEPWAQELFTYIFEDHIEATREIAMLDLCFIYLRLGELEKLKKLYNVAIKEFPHDEYLFTPFFKESEGK